ncbi:MAG: hypothetical protein WD738_00605 [Pirellulales bacterium]
MFRPINMLSLAAAAMLMALAATAPRATADHFCYNGCCDCNYMRPVERARWYNWNRNYAYTDYGVPVALVVPPTANMQTNWGWGVASSRITRIDHQFQRNFPGYPIGAPFGGPYRPTPIWPSDTSQFGVYYVRGPW